MSDLQQAAAIFETPCKQRRQNILHCTPSPSSTFTKGELGGIETAGGWENSTAMKINARSSYDIEELYLEVHDSNIDVLPINKKISVLPKPKNADSSSEKLVASPVLHGSAEFLLPGNIPLPISPAQHSSQPRAITRGRRRFCVRPVTCLCRLEAEARRKARYIQVLFSDHVLYGELPS